MTDKKRNTKRYKVPLNVPNLQLKKARQNSSKLKEKRNIFLKQPSQHWPEVGVGTSGNDLEKIRKKYGKGKGTKRKRKSRKKRKRRRKTRKRKRRKKSSSRK